MLKIPNTPTSLVIAGAWNPDILTPKWVAKEVLGLQLGQNFPVNVQVPIGNPTHRPTYEFENIKYVSSRTSLSFFIDQDDSEQIRKSVSTVKKILELLVHTPITGFGFNLFFEIENPTTALLDTFSSGSLLINLIEGNDMQTVGENWKSIIKADDYLLSLDALLEGGKVLLSFNVHFEVLNAAEAAEQLQDENLFGNIKSLVQKIANSLDVLGE